VHASPDWDLVGKPSALELSVSDCQVKNLNIAQTRTNITVTHKVCTLVLRKLPQFVTIPIASSLGSPSPYSFLCHPFFLLAEVKDEDDDVAAVVVLSSMCRELLWTRMRKHPLGLCRQIDAC
jgi:hypothetical protein